MTETHKHMLETLVKDIELVEPLLNDDGHLKTKYCYWWLVARTQRLSEIANGFGLEGTNGFERKGCYTCNIKMPKCDVHYDWGVD